MKKIAFHTLGCKLNFAETSHIAQTIEGMEIVDFGDVADYYVINSCSVTAHAEKKCRTLIKNSRKHNPEASIVVMGCYSELDAENVAEIDGVDYVIGNNSKYRLNEILLHNKSYVENKHILDNAQFYHTFSGDDRTRTFVKVQDGCDYFCTYCTIPYARGLSRSPLIKDLLPEFHQIAASKSKEVVLTGVNIGDFGRKNGETFFQLIQELVKIEGIERYRISSIEPNLLTNEIIEFVAKSDKILPHFHIPIQAPNNNTLLRMKRKYTVEFFDQRIEKIKELMPNACIAVDCIVGFPGETVEDFEKGLEYIKNSKISYLHLFTYSDRPKAKASKFEGKISGQEKKRRVKLLHEASDKLKLDFYTQNIGAEADVLVENRNNGEYMYGWTENYIRVKIDYNKNIQNKIIKVKLKKIDNDNIFLCKFVNNK